MSVFVLLSNLALKFILLPINLLGIGVHVSQRGNSEGYIITLTCDQVLVLVDVELHTAQALGGVCVDVLHMLNFVEALVHLQDTRNKSELKKTAGKGEEKTVVHPSTPSARIKTACRLFVFLQEFLWREGVQSSALH